MSSHANDHGGLSLTGRRWRAPALCDLRAGSQGEERPRWLVQLLAHRGMTGEAEVARHLAPSLASLDDPSRMADMAAAIEVLSRALREQRRIVVYGDYDVDGVCSTALLVEALQKLGGTVEYYIPERKSEGYGLNAAAVQELCAKANVLITTDCGITACDEVALARALGCEVVIVDHHRVGSALPAANAALDPHRADCAFAFKDLCATGVAFMLVCGLRRALREAGWFASRTELDVRDSLDLVALATVADVVPLCGHNRVLVAAGLKRMGHRPRLGLAALCATANILPAALSSYDLGYKLGPRINARGRLDNAMQAVELMLTRDETRARLLAALLDGANRERREIEKTTLAAAVARLEQEPLDDCAAIVIEDASWHPGVLGLVATRLAKRYGRPAIVIGEGGKGSGRSAAGLDLHASIQAASEHLVRFGGHAAAAGITILAPSLPAFRAAFTAEARRRLGAPPYVVELHPDLEVEATGLSLDMLPLIEQLAPFGQQNPAPLWVSRGLEVRSVRVVGGEHLKLTLAGTARLEAIAFGMGALAERLPPRIDLAYRLERNTYGGRNTLELKVEDIAAS